MMTDPIADMLTRIRNAQQAQHSKVRIPRSMLKRSVVDILVREGYLQNAEGVDEGVGGAIEVTLRYIEDQPAIRKLKRESTPGRRVYVKWDQIPRVLGGMGLAIVSTSSGVMTGREARRKRIGGELMCTIY